jgi:hypothetical protein
MVGGGTGVSETVDNAKKNRQELKNKRNQLYKLFLKNPMYTRLAVEIKFLDDQLAECDQSGVLVQDR